MSLIIQKKIKLHRSPLDISLFNNQLYVCTKSNKLTVTDMNLKSKKFLSFKNNINRLVNDGTTLLCISNNMIFKYNSSKIHQTNVKYEISYIKKLEEEDKFLIGCKDGKVFYSSLDFKPLRYFYGSTNKILDVCNTKDKMISSDNKLVVTDLKTSKIKTTNIGFINCISFYNKKMILLGTDTGLFLYDTEKDKVINKFVLDSPVSCMEIIKDVILIGCENGILHECKVIYNDLKILQKNQLAGVINFIKYINNGIFVGK
ncbi:WD40 repeat domain-containing protein [Vairimorpha necatrix]|uniref:WD40 repeat domain-containing protein n=1 Tax=Vairimorpha necatrix TaxID=6039 RepID=A0AAX4JGD3_9MICR